MPGKPENNLTEESVRQTLQAAQKDIAAAADAEAVEAARVNYLGRKRGLVSGMFDALRSTPPEARAALGKALNAARKEIEDLLTSATLRVAVGGKGQAQGAALDLTLPGERGAVGRRHVLSQTTELLVEVASTLGFSVAEGPEVETEEQNFEALNIPMEHPSHDPFDTFYIETAPGAEKLVLRSHTSPVQVRVLRRTSAMNPDDPPAVRVVVPGRTYRPDKVDATHYHTFHQIEGLAVDVDITFQDLKYTLELFAKGVFGTDVRARFRPSFFPFTEPSAEMDVSCPFCRRDGAACPVCKATGWLEILGCGMVHPRVLDKGGYDPKRFTGFAFGMGIERIAMLRHGIRDIRLFIDPERGNDIRFLEQF